MRTLATIFFITTIIAVGIAYLFFDKWLDARNVTYTCDTSLGECITELKPCRVIGEFMVTTSTASIYIPTSTPEIIEAQEIENPIDIPAGFSDCEWIIQDGYGDFYCDTAQNTNLDNNIMNVYYNPFAYPEPIYIEPIEPEPELEEPVCLDWIGFGDKIDCYKWE